MNVVEMLFNEWGLRETYPVTEEEFFTLIKEEGDKTWTTENQDNGDGTYTNELDINGHKYTIVTQKKLQVQEK